MRFSKWHALGNVYLVTTRLSDRSPERIRELVGDADGLLEVAARGDDEAEVVIWNPDGSQAEISGNGTRIAAAWLAAETGARAVRIRTDGRDVLVRFRDVLARFRDEGTRAILTGPAEPVVRVRRAEPDDADAVADVFTQSFGSLTFLPRLQHARRGPHFHPRRRVPAAGGVGRRGRPPDRRLRHAGSSSRTRRPGASTRRVAAVSSG